MAAEEVLFLGPDGLINQAFIDGAGDAAEGAYITFAGLPTGELEGPGADYVTRMSEILGHSPDAYAVYAYETTVVVIQAIDRSARRTAPRSSTPCSPPKASSASSASTWSFTETGDTDSDDVGQRDQAERRRQVHDYLPRGDRRLAAFAGEHERDRRLPWPARVTLTRDSPQVVRTQR